MFIKSSSNDPDDLVAHSYETAKRHQYTAYACTSQFSKCR
jgi:hypothetical protein